jgi:predicted nucleic acid-binding protein
MSIMSRASTFYPRTDACCSAHSIAEVYATLTAMPGRRRVSGDEALLFLDNIRERLTLGSLDQQDYFRVAKTSAEAGLTSGAIYDAILAHCALKAKAQLIYAWNVKDFLRLPAIANRVKTPART